MSDIEKIYRKVAKLIAEAIYNEEDEKLERAIELLEKYKKEELNINVEYVYKIENLNGIHEEASTHIIVVKDIKYKHTYTTDYVIIVNIQYSIPHKAVVTFVEGGEVTNFEFEEDKEIRIIEDEYDREYIEIVDD